MTEKRVCIIGAGPSGLTAIKACLEAGLKPVCYEKTPDLGGLWRYRPDNVDGVSSVMKSTVINTSKEINAFSDFPPPKEYSNYMHNEWLLEYLKMYAETFDLARHVIFNSSIVQVSKTKDHSSTGRWDVQVQNKSGDIVSETFDAVLVCIGHHVYPNIPKFPGIDIFKGNVLHTHDLKSGSGFEDARVLVIGIGNSGVDAAVELSRVSKQVYVSTRKGCWILGRLGVNGMPSDLSALTRANDFIYMNCLPWNITNSLMESVVTQRLDHSLYGLKPNHRLLEQHPTVNDDLPNRILAGTVQIKDDVDHFTEDGVCFKGDKTLYNLDAVILATGYQIKFPFISSDVVTAENNQVTLYKYVFPPTEGPSTLAIIGLIQPRGSILPISEIQCRWATAVFTGLCKLPSPTRMLSEIAEKRQAMRKRFVPSPRHTIQVDFIRYMDEIADLVGAKPNLLKLALTDPKLCWECIFGTCYAYQYRLNGPHPWSGAAEAMLTAESRIVKPFKTREPKGEYKVSFLLKLLSPFWIIVFLLFVIWIMAAV